MKKILLILLILILNNSVSAETITYNGNGGEVVTVQNDQKGDFLIKIEGVKTSWSDKVFKVKKREAASGDRYWFEYDYEIGDEIQKRKYEVLVDSGKALRNGSLVKRVQLYTPDRNGNPTELFLSAQSSSKVDLVKQFKKTPFTPQID